MITINKDQIHFSFDPAEKPCAYASSGSVVRFCCQDCYCGQMQVDHGDYLQMDNRRNPATGPLSIHNAEPGDVLRVEILAIDLASEGTMCARPGAGIYNIQGYHCRRFKLENGQILFDQGIRLPVSPMVGVIGTAPKTAPLSTKHPGEHGGNLDIRDLGVGALLYLPVNVPGALLSMGDVHAVQGDGETVTCAMEMSAEVTVKVDLLKNRSDIPTPFLLAGNFYLTTAADPSLDVCSLAAARKMQAFLQQHSGLTDVQSAMLLSLAGNLRISQVVNPAKGCLMQFPVGLAREQFER